LAEELALKQAAELEVKKNYTSLKDEIDHKSKKITSIILKLKEGKQ